MQILATFTAQDVEPDAPLFDYDAFKTREAVRAVVLDGDRVALLHVGKHDYYMLPGGGIEDDDVLTGLRREILEELGFEIEIGDVLGGAVVYFDQWKQKQTDYCYAVRKVGGFMGINPTDFEIEEGHKVVWASDIDAAINLVEQARPENRDGKLVRARDLLFLKTAALL